MPEKRPYPPDGPENGDPKRSRSDNGSSAADLGANGSHANELSEVDRKRQEAAERIAAMKARMAAAQASKAAPPAVAKSDPEAAKRDAADRIAALKARLSGGGSKPSPSPGPASPGLASASPGPPNDAAARAQAQLAALKVRAAIQRNDPRAAPPPPPQRDDGDSRARGGLGVAMHPALMGDLGAKPATKDNRSGNKQRGMENKPKVNPYLTEESSTDQRQTDDAGFDPGLQRQRDRKSRAMVFNQKGKFIAQAEALRNQERLEQMKQQLQMEQRKKEIEEATERSFLVAEPPQIEWWDEALVNGEEYGNLDDPSTLNFDTVTEYVQHPVLLEPPQDKNMPAPKPMYLTKKEQAKMRRQRRMEDHKEEQAKIRLGLVPPPPPKVKKSNLMRVLGQEAVKDPTAVELRVNREIAEREDKHLEANEDRKLTKEQRAEKLANQQEGDAQRGVQVCVFRIENLSYGQHRYKVDVNAKQNALTGITILNPKMNLVIVEGGRHSIRNYKKLMLNRIKWHENAAPISSNEKNTEPEQEWLQNLDDSGMVKDLSYNKCTLVWEGEEKDRAFKRWTSRVCETDGEAKDVLSRNKMGNMWTLAQSMQLD